MQTPASLSSLLIPGALLEEMLLATATTLLHSHWGDLWRMTEWKKRKSTAISQSAREEKVHNHFSHTKLIKSFKTKTGSQNGWSKVSHFWRKIRGENIALRSNVVGFLSGQASTWKAKAVLEIICKRRLSPLLKLRQVLQLGSRDCFALGCLRYEI